MHILGINIVGATEWQCIAQKEAEMEGDALLRKKRTCNIPLMGI